MSLLLMVVNVWTVNTTSTSLSESFLFPDHRFFVFSFSTLLTSFTCTGVVDRAQEVVDLTSEEQVGENTPAKIPSKVKKEEKKKVNEEVAREIHTSVEGEVGQQVEKHLVRNRPFVEGDRNMVVEEAANGRNNEGNTGSVVQENVGTEEHANRKDVEKDERVQGGEAEVVGNERNTEGDVRTRENDNGEEEENKEDGEEGNEHSNEGENAEPPANSSR